MKRVFELNFYADSEFSAKIHMLVLESGNNSIKCIIFKFRVEGGGGTATAKRSPRRYRPKNQNFENCYSDFRFDSKLYLKNSKMPK